MKNYLVKIILMLSVSILVASCNDRIGWNAGVSFGGPGHYRGGHLSHFHMSIGNYYGVPHSHVSFLVGSGWHDDDISVVFFLSGRSGVGYRTIVQWRSGGMSWMDITYKLKLSPDVFYYNAGGPPYGKAYGYYGKPKSKWKKMKFKDSQIVDIVNTRFISQSQGRSPKSVMKMRKEGKSFKSMGSSGGKGGKSGKAYKEDRGGKVYKGDKGGKDYKKDRKGRRDKEEEERGRGRGRGR